MSNQVQLILPLGFRFAPMDEELVIYLKKKIKNEPLPYNGICSINIYKYHPRELTEIYPSLGKDEWYFFTSRDRKYPNGSRPNRAAGDGHWKATVADQKVYDNNDCIGFKKTLVFFQGKPQNCKKTNWIMHEYTVDHPPRHPKGTNDNMQLEDCVLCHIYERKKTVAKIEIEAIHESSENENLTSHKRARTEHENTNHPWHHHIPAQHDLQLLQPNLLMHQQNQPALKYSPIVANHINPGQLSVPGQQQNQLGGQLDYCLQRALEDIEYTLFDDLENDNEIYFDLSTGDMVDHQPDASVIDNELENLYLRYENLNDFAPHSSMYCFEPNLSLINIGHPQECPSCEEINQSERPQQGEHSDPIKFWRQMLCGESVVD